jgi:type II secretory pathway component PulC
MRTPLDVARTALVVLPLAVGSCAGKAPASRAVEAPVAQAPAPAPESPADATTRSVTRSAVHAIVSQGLGMFLRRVDLDDQPVFVGGKFHGFRIAALRDAQFWSGVDIKPGDVVTSVNGFPIEHPEQALTAFDSLEVASELRVAFERGGERRELVYAIVDR